MTSSPRAQLSVTLVSEMLSLQALCDVTTLESVGAVPAQGDVFGEMMSSQLSTNYCYCICMQEFLRGVKSALCDQEARKEASSMCRLLKPRLANRGNSGLKCVPGDVGDSLCACGACNTLHRQYNC